MKSGLQSETKRRILKPLGIVLLALAASLLLTRCGSEKDNNTDTLEPTFSSIYTNVLVSNCASCHAPGEAAYDTNMVEIDLTSKTTAYNTIRNGVVTATTADPTCAGLNYISAGNANASYFAAVIDTGINPTFNSGGCAAPTNTHVNGSVSLTADEEDAIATWINQGAANN